MKKRVFIAQPFDGQKYDKRYTDVYEPAIIKAGFEPYRVDRDPSASIPIDEIESNIESSVFVFSDISEDNPNVWFEVGYSIAKGKEICFVCSKERYIKNSKFPFDIQHRSIIVYENSSKSDWDNLERSILDRMQAIHERIENKRTIDRAISERSVVSDEKTLKLSDMELSGFALVASSVPISSGISEYRYNDKMDDQGYNGLAVNISAVRLIKAKLIERFDDFDHDGDQFPAFRLTNKGWEFLEENLGIFSLKKNVKIPSRDFDNEIPV